MMFNYHSTYEKPVASSSESNRRIYNFLKVHPVGVLAMVDPEGNPHATVIYFSVDEEFNITFTTKRDTKKHDNLKHNNHVQLIAYEASSQTTVQITGIAKDISHEPEASEAFSNTVRASMQTSGADVPPISKLQAGHYVAYKLSPKQIRMAIFARPDPGGYDIYETIDFVD